MTDRPTPERPADWPPSPGRRAGALLELPMADHGWTQDEKQWAIDEIARLRAEMRRVVAVDRPPSDPRPLVYWHVQAMGLDDVDRTGCGAPRDSMAVRWTRDWYAVTCATCRGVSSVSDPPASVNLHNGHVYYSDSPAVAGGEGGAIGGTPAATATFSGRSAAGPSAAEDDDVLDDLYLVLGDDGESTSTFSRDIATRIYAEWDARYPEDAPHRIARFKHVGWEGQDER